MRQQNAIYPSIVRMDSAAWSNIFILLLSVSVCELEMKKFSRRKKISSDKKNINESSFRGKSVMKHDHNSIINMNNTSMNNAIKLL